MRTNRNTQHVRGPGHKSHAGETGRSYRYHRTGFNPFRWLWQRAYGRIVNPLTVAIARLTGKAAAT